MITITRRKEGRKGKRCFVEKGKHDCERTLHVVIIHSSFIHFHSLSLSMIHCIGANSTADLRQKRKRNIKKQVTLLKYFFGTKKHSGPKVTKHE
jgi:hypothetical protein